MTLFWTIVMALIFVSFLPYIFGIIIGILTLIVMGIIETVKYIINLFK